MCPVSNKLHMRMTFFTRLESRSPNLLEAEVRERLVRFCHAVYFIAFLHRAATAFSRFHQLTAKALWHGFFAALVSSFAQPTHRQRHTTDWTNLDRHLVVSTTNATGFHFHHRLSIADCS